MEGVCRREERSCRRELLEGEAGATGPARRRLFSPHRLIIKIPVRNASHCSSDALEAHPRSCRPRRWPGRVVSSRPYPGKADSGVGFSLQWQHRANRLAQGGQPVAPFKTETANTLQPALEKSRKTSPASLRPRVSRETRITYVIVGAMSLQPHPSADRSGAIDMPLALRGSDPSSGQVQSYNTRVMSPNRLMLPDPNRAILQ